MLSYLRGVRQLFAYWRINLRYRIARHILNVRQHDPRRRA